jgi:site-specific recombinase
MHFLSKIQRRDTAAQLLDRKPIQPDEEQVWLHDVLAWLLRTPPEFRTERLHFLAQALDQHAQAEEMRATLRRLWTHHSAVRLLSEAGLPNEAYFIRELTGRVFSRFIPADEVDGDLYAVLESLDLDLEDAEWLCSLSQSTVEYWAKIIAPRPESIEVAVRVLALRAANLALSKDLIALAPALSVSHSPFLHLVASVESAWRGDSEGRAVWANQRLLCMQEIRHSHKSLQARGASATATYRLRLLQALLHRIDDLLKLHAGEAIGRDMAAHIMRGLAGQGKVTGLITTCSRRLARKIVEQTGRAGEHYIAGDRTEYVALSLKSLEAGAITAVTALVKYIVALAEKAPLLVGFGHSLNYSFSFLLMQFGGLPLASKMPALTAAALVEEMENGQSGPIVKIAAIVRSQVAVTLGNLAGAIPLAIVIDRLWLLVKGVPFLSEAQAEHGVQMLRPFGSPTIFYALITGLFLWVASVVTGMTANWMAHRKLEQGLRKSFRLRRRLGAAGARRLADLVLHHGPGACGYIVLGFLLGMLPVIISLWGIPLEVRHVTLAAASLSYAVDALAIRHTLQLSNALWAFTGVLVTGVCNIGASFLASYLVALRAREVRGIGTWRLVSAVMREVFRNPRKFVLPEEVSETAVQ